VELSQPEPAIRPERAGDAQAIRAVTEAAFRGVAHSAQTEGAIIEALRKAGALSLSLVAVCEGRIVGHIAFSPVRIEGRDTGWFGLGPVSVAPDLQGQGIGSALIRKGLASLKARKAAGCVLLGNPGYYARFGFSSDHALRYPGPPSEYFQSLVLSGSPAAGLVTYHLAFEAH
jgi:putative acetyltransferase